MLEWRYPDKPQSATSEFLSFIKEDEWYSTSKLDGWRMSIYTDKDKNAKLFTRMGNLIQNATKVPLPLVKAVSQLCENIPALSVLDCEFVGPRGGHQPAVYLFDVMAWDGNWLNAVPFESRWQLAETEVNRFIVPGSNVHMVETVTSGFMDHFNLLKQIWYNGGCSTLDLHEGIVLKRKKGVLTLSLQTSVKSRHLIKIKYRDARRPTY